MKSQQGTKYQFATIMWKPFEVLNVSKSVAPGLFVLIVLCIVSYMNKVHFPGLIDISFFPEGQIFHYLAEAFIPPLLLTFILSVSGYFIYSMPYNFWKLFGSMSIARFPLLLVAIGGSFFNIPLVGEILEATATGQQYPGHTLFITGIVLYLIFGVVMMVWMVRLLYHAYTSVFTGKGSKGVLHFIGSFILAEALCKVSFYYLYA